MNARLKKLGGLSLHAGHFAICQVGTKSPASLPSSVIHSVVPCGSGLMITARGNIYLFDPTANDYRRLFRRAGRKEKVNVITDLYVSGSNAL